MSWEAELMPSDTAAPQTGWTNWSGNQVASDARVHHPLREDDLRACLTSAQGPVRLVGAGHSFTPLTKTSGRIISLDRLAGQITSDLPARTARIPAGARLYDLSLALEQSGLAFRNLGDINVQSFAGAAATATHGTGETFQCLAAEMRAVRMMAANGDILEASRDDNPDLLRAAQVSLGALGVLLEAEINLQPVYKLHRRTWAEPITEIIDTAPDRWKTHRNYEFFYMPFSGYGINISHDETQAEITERPPSSDEEGLANLKSLRDKLKWSTAMRRTLLSSVIKRTPPEDTIGLSWKLLANERNTLFNEMEYHLPPETALEAFAELIKQVEAKHRDVFFPIEVRKTAGDDAWLSPFNQGPRVSVAVHAMADEPYDWFFETAEPIFRAAGGRPHWGKLHSLGAAELSALYPDFTRFVALRHELDPDGVFMTPDMAKLWGEAL